MSDKDKKDKNKFNPFGDFNKGSGGNGPEGDDSRNRLFRNLMIWALLSAAILTIYFFGFNQNSFETRVSYNQYVEFVENGSVKEAVIRQSQGENFEFVGDFGKTRSITVNDQTVSTQKFVAKLGFVDEKTQAFWNEHGVKWTYVQADNTFWAIMINLLPWVILFAAVYFFFFRRMQSGAGGQRGIFSFGKSRAKLLNESQSKVTFKEVAGADEAKYELEEIIEFLKSPTRFQKLGGKIPKGVLMLGPPGTGKTLLARAVSGEAEVPFFSISGADFVEMFVGVGASRVRDLFEQAKKSAPCLVFIDEIDAVGRHRGAGLGGGHDEREQTLNQLLVEMDGFEQNSGVIIIAATNRPDVLDPALLRPGRFDRQIVVDRPDVKGREGIFKVHARDIPVGDDVEFGALARGTPGFSGADIANIVNEAALYAARRNSEKVAMYDFEYAKDKVLMGIERKSMVISDKEKKMTAYHEMGHAIVSKFSPNSDPVHKITIIPRGRALGLTAQLPVEEMHSMSRDYLESKITMLMAGRAAEKLVFGQVTNGAANDIDRATSIARKMVCDWGMSEKLGPVKYASQQEEVFLGREIAQNRDHSEKTAQAIDDEIRKIVNYSGAKASEILDENIDMLHRLSEILVRREVIDADEFEKLVKGEELPPINEKTLGALKTMKINDGE